MDSVVTEPEPPSRTRPRRWTPRHAVAIAEAAPAGVGGVYLASGSFAVTVTAALAVVVMFALLVWALR